MPERMSVVSLYMVGLVDTLSMIGDAGGLGPGVYSAVATSIGAVISIRARMMDSSLVGFISPSPFFIFSVELLSDVYDLKFSGIIFYAHARCPKIYPTFGLVQNAFFGMALNQNQRLSCSSALPGLDRLRAQVEFLGNDEHYETGESKSCGFQGRVFARLRLKGSVLFVFNEYMGKHRVFGRFERKKRVEGVEGCAISFSLQDYALVVVEG